MKFRTSAENIRFAEAISRSPEETQGVGLQLARILPIPGVVMLRGALGTGKTTFARGIAQGLGLNDPTLVHSPSFTLVNIYYGICAIYHVDLYRLQGSRDLSSIGLDDFLGKDGVTIIEWSEKLSYTFGQAAEVELQDAGDDLRIVRIIFPGMKRPTRGSVSKNKTLSGRGAQS